MGTVTEETEVAEEKRPTALLVTYHVPLAAGAKCVAVTNHRGEDFMWFVMKNGDVAKLSCAEVARTEERVRL